MKILELHSQLDEQTQKDLEPFLIIKDLTHIFMFYLEDYLVIETDPEVSIDVIPRQEAIDEVKRKYPDRKIDILEDETLLQLVKDHLLKREIADTQAWITPFLDQFEQAKEEHKTRYLAIADATSKSIAESTDIKVQRLGALLDKLALFSSEELHGKGYQVTRQNVILTSTVRFFGDEI